MDTLANDARTRRFELLATPHLDAAFNLARWLTGNTADAEKPPRGKAVTVHYAFHV